MTADRDGAIAAALAELVELDRDELAHRWTKVFGSAAPKRCHAQLLRGALAWHFQAMGASGNTQASKLRKRLRAACLAPATALSPGSILVREWQGKRFQVTVLPKGFEFEGKPCRSLSAIARTITGTNWSGLRFFGVKPSGKT